MLKSLTIYGQQPASAGGYFLPIGNGLVGAGVDVNQSSVQIKDIDGVGPVKASIVTDGYAGLPGNYFSGSSVGSRNIVLKMGLNPNWATQTMESLRMELYKFLMPQQPVTLHFESSHLPNVEIDGYVEDFVENMFSKDPEMQISIVCPYPFFTAVDQTAIFGVSGTTTVVDYEGSVPTGFTLRVGPRAGGYTGEIRVQSGYTIGSHLPTPFLSQLVVTTVTLDATHSFEIITIPGRKDLHPYADTSGNSRLDLLEEDSVWLQLSTGNNDFDVLTEATNGIPWVLIYHALYGGL